MSPTIGEKIVQYSGSADGDDQIPVHHILRDVTDSAVTIEKHPLKTFFDRNFRIPEYQRGYEWGEENWEELWEEINNVFEIDDTSVDDNLTDIFFGSMFFAERSGEKIGEDDFEIVYDIIDGQQRITTLTILFKIMSERLYHNMDEDTDLYRTLSGEPNRIEQLIYRDVGAGIEEHPSLLPNRHQRGLFNAMMGDDDDLLVYLLARERVHGNTKNDAIQVREFLNSFDIDTADYLTAVDNDEYYGENIDGRPNLRDSQLQDVRKKDDMSDVSPDSALASDLLSNKVEINDDTQILIDAHVYFKKKIKYRLEELDTPKQRAYAIVNIKNYILHSYIIGYFEVESDQPKLLMKIFEILNDRGMELKKADVMRTRIVACFRNEIDRDDYVKKWEQIVKRFGNERIIDFLRTYFVVKGEATSRGDLKDHLLEAFERNPRTDSKRKIDSRLSDADDARRFLDDLSTYAKYYDDITDLENRGIDLGEEGNEEVQQRANRIIMRLQSADTSIWEPLILSVYHDIAEEDISEQSQLTDLLKAVESLAIRKFATMGTQTRDQAYADTIKEYHNNGLSGDLVDTLIDIKVDDPSAIGEQLVEGFYRADWRKQWGKPVLRKIATENLATEDDEMVHRDLNLSEDIIHLEHIFPQSPLRSDAQDKYIWFKKFFRTEEGLDQDGHSDSTEGGDGTNMDINEMISQFISAKKDDILENIAEEYIQDIGNLTLLHNEGNLSVQNGSFDIKAVAYKNTKDYCELETSAYICESVLNDHSDDISEYSAVQKALEQLEEESNHEGGKEWAEIADDLDISIDSEDELRRELRSRQERLNEKISKLQGAWTYEEVTENRAHLVRELCNLIALEDDEFEDVDFEEMSREITDTKNDIITANNRRQLG